MFIRLFHSQYVLELRGAKWSVEGNFANKVAPRCLKRKEIIIPAVGQDAEVRAGGREMEGMLIVLEIN